MKQTLTFHKQCLNALRASEERALKEVESAEFKLMRIRGQRALLEGQVKRAEAEGRDGFDSDKFHTALGLKPRRAS